MLDFFVMHPREFAEVDGLIGPTSLPKLITLDIRKKNALDRADG